VVRGNRSALMKSTEGEAGADPAPVLTTAAKLYEQLKEMAVSYHFRPGERINEVELSGQLRVSRTPLREALNRLSTEGFLTTTANKGFFARELEANELFDLYELRAYLEQAGVRLACKRASDEDIAALRAFVLERDETSEILAGEMLKLDEEFHLRLVGLSQNEELVKSVRSVSERIRFARWIDWKSRRLSHGQHLQIVTLLAGRQEDECAAFMLSHIQKHFDQIREIIRGAVTEIYTRNSENRRKDR
jgi:DNA-binding GntR family transcriptional regulator